ITFYTLDGDLVHVPSNHIRTAQVDRQRTEFSVGAIIPSYLRGRTGAIQITFHGTKKASFLLKVKL
ncbi:hypothetical protein OH407_24390, partial [Salmonella enterica]|uniref:hypothetical protein n=1 Tax=Salmonella enterica TaxID=28901 RepID=UPI0022B5EAC8